jgi:cobalt-precorrin 5A hydrolase
MGIDAQIYTEGKFNMQYAYFAVSKEGLSLVARMQQQFEGELISLSGIRSVFSRSEALVFVMPTAAVLRLLMPFIEVKDKGPAILVIDQKGKFVIPLLPGRLGEGNDIAKSLALFLGAKAVITTASDLNQVVSFKQVAADNSLDIIHPEALSRINARLLQGVTVELHTDHEILPESPLWDQSSIRAIQYDPEDFRLLLRGYQKCINEQTAAVFITSRTMPTREDGAYPSNILILSPRDIVIGVTCQSRVNEEYLYDAMVTTLDRQNLTESAVCILAASPLMAKEPAVLSLAKRLDAPLTIVDSEEIRRVAYRFKQVPFEKHPSHSENISAPCAYLASQKGRMLLVSTTFPGGVTFAIAQERKIIRF